MRNRPTEIYAFREDWLIVLTSKPPKWVPRPGQWQGLRPPERGAMVPWLFEQLYGYVLDDPRDLLLFDEDGNYVDGWTHVEGGDK